MAKKGSRLRWGVEQRLEFIDFRLLWEGRINRQDLIDYFGVSVPQASTDLKRYQEIAPENMGYDNSAKTYLATDSFAPCFSSPSPDRYLSELKSVTDGLAELETIWPTRVPDFDALPTPHRRIDPVCFRAILHAINEGQSIAIEYQSMSDRDRMWRWITPHALASDGSRWHVRACCHLDRYFKDFMLSRILDTRETQVSDVDAKADLPWHTKVTARFEPHPDASPSLRRAIEDDYEMTNGALQLPVRAAMVYYLNKAMRLVDDWQSVTTKDQQIVFVNKDDIEEERTALEDESKAMLSNVPLVGVG